MGKKTACNISNKIKKLDAFGRKITLTWEGNEHFRTDVGGCFTLLAGIIIGSFAIEGLVRVFQN
jgi:hypothetical protein